MRARAVTLNGRLYEVLREDLLRGQRLPGQKLKIAALAATHGVSLNVVREALNRLVGEGLVAAEPQMGFSVRTLSAADLTDLIDNRVLLESVALRRNIEVNSVDWESEVLAAHHRLHNTPTTIDGTANPQWVLRHDEFHRALLSNCGSTCLFRLIRQLADIAEIYQRVLMPLAAPRLEGDAEHQALLDAVMNHDAEKAVEVLGRHLEGGRDAMLKVLRRQETPRAAAEVGTA
jgi:DNA-binding GntR family transcriptional regulator